MGGTTFYDEHPANVPIGEAFASLVERAAWEHGHGGYTGTIAEKHGYVEFKVPSNLTAQDVTKLIREYEESRWSESTPAPDIPPGLDLKRMYEVYDDKWGPAVAFRSGDVWVFCGWASC